MVCEIVLLPFNTPIDKDGRILYIVDGSLDQNDLTINVADQ